MGHPFKGWNEGIDRICQKIKPKVKDADIHVYGGGKLWGWEDTQYRKLYDDLIRNKILYHGQTGQKKDNAST